MLGEMEEGSKVRLVRCPKCENLLQELPDYSVYQCGGCGAVLRANTTSTATDELSEKPERTGGANENLEGLSEKGASSLVNPSVAEVESQELEHGGKREGVLSEIATNLINSPPKTESNMNVYNGTTRKDVVSGSRLGSHEDREFGYVDKYRHSSKVGEFANGSSKSREVTDRWATVRDGIGAFSKKSRPLVERGRFSTFPCSDEGPSNHHPGSYNYGEPIRTHENKVENLEQDRVELLRKLDELKDQLTQSCDVVEKPRERLPVDRRVALPDSYMGRDPYKPPYIPLEQPFSHDKPPHLNSRHRPVPYGNGHDIDMENFYYPPRHVQNEFPGYTDPYWPPQVLNQQPRQYPRRPTHHYYSGQFVDFNQDPLEPYPREPLFNQSTCSCSQCYNKNWHASTQAPPNHICNRTFSDDPTNPVFYHHVSPTSFDPRGYKFHSREPQPRATRPSNDLDSYADDFGLLRPRRVVVAKGNERLCRPIAGGSPFITCCNCFYLLKVPKKLLAREKNQQKLRCGACSTVILLNIEHKRITVSVPMQTKLVSSDVDDGSGEGLNEYLPSCHGGLNSSSEDFDNACYNFHLTDSEPNLVSKDNSNQSESEKRRDLSSTTSSSEGEESPDSVDLKNLSPLTGSPLHEHFDHLSSSNNACRFAKGNISKRTDQENASMNKSTSRQNSVKDASVATEMDLSFNEGPNHGLCQDAVDASKEEERPKNKGSESFFTGLIKKSFRDLSKSYQSVENGRYNVSVNGHPLPDRVVKKAEKVAGPIQPGEYWYDSRAGFWGMIGQPCGGIIPPLIEEFNYPMPENCAGGNTGIFVNGRELHRKDLDLLASRGLPATRDKSYIIEISGKVVDEDSAEELDGLGKLAPTVEKVKHGFGMRPPKVIV